MSAISAIYFLDRKGRIIIFRNYRGEVDQDISEGFINEVLELDEANMKPAFTIDDVHPHDIAAIFAEDNVCIRAGHHCAQPLHILLGIPSTVRASLAFYNTDEDIEKFLGVLSTIRSRMGYE